MTWRLLDGEPCIAVESNSQSSYLFFPLVINSSVWPPHSIAGWQNIYFLCLITNNILHFWTWVWRQSEEHRISEKDGISHLFLSAFGELQNDVCRWHLERVVYGTMMSSFWLFCRQHPLCATWLPQISGHYLFYTWTLSLPHLD